MTIRLGTCPGSKRRDEDKETKRSTCQRKEVILSSGGRVWALVGAGPSHQHR